MVETATCARGHSENHSSTFSTRQIDDCKALPKPATPSLDAFAQHLWCSDGSDFTAGCCMHCAALF